MAVKRIREAHSGADEEANSPLQAVLLADSFSQNFRPMTLERPKVLLPLVNIPMIDYTLEWLAYAGIEEVFVVCCAHANLVKSHLDNSAWNMQEHFKIVPIVAQDCASVGGALRIIHQKNVVCGDFVLVSGDIVSNMSLKEAFQVHKERRRKDKSAVMTMVVKRVNRSIIAHDGNNDLMLVIDSLTKELLQFDDGDSRNSHYKFSRQVVIDSSLYRNKPSICICNNLQDCHIDVCSQEVLQIFTENFDYQRIREDFVEGILIDELAGHKIFTYEVNAEYAACIDSLRSYSAVSNHIMQRWTYPLVPDIQFFGDKVGAGKAVRSDCCNVYRENGCPFQQSTCIGLSSVLGDGSSIGENCTILNSIIGRNCAVGKNVVIEGSFVWNNVTIQDNAHIQHAIICDGCVIKAGATIQSGSILSFNVNIGEEVLVPSFSKISLFAQPLGEGISEDELEHLEALNASSERVNEVGSLDDSELRPEVMDGLSHIWNEAEVGASGAGFQWFIDAKHGKEWRHSVAPMPIERMKEIRFEAQKADLDDADQDWEDAGVENEDDEAGDLRTRKHDFDEEAEELFRRIFVDKLPESSVCRELQALRVCSNFDRPDCVNISDCAGACFKSIMKLALKEPYQTSRELFVTANRLLYQWRELLQQYLGNEDDQVELILQFEEICADFGRAFAPIFCNVLHALYEQETVSEDAILSWASEKQCAGDEDTVFLRQCETFIKWLKEAPEEDDP